MTYTWMSNLKRESLMNTCRPWSHKYSKLRKVTALLLLAGMTEAAVADNLRIENVTFIRRVESSGDLRAIFDVKWQNAWNNSKNHDAAWIFLKFIYPDGGYAHINIESTGHRIVEMPGAAAPRATIDVAENGVGFFIYPAESHRGDVKWRVSVKLDSSAAENRYRRAKLEVYGIEMVYVPQGPFSLGDPDTTSLGFGAFYEADANGRASGLFRIKSEDQIQIGKGKGQLYYRRQNQYQGDQNGPVPASFPKGFHAFYVMKYEISQGQYVSFLNSLSVDHTFERFSFGGRSYFEKRGTIKLEGGRYVAGKPERPLNFLSWDDGLAFGDWAALRPMTELEFTKASRGPDKPLAGEFPWGTSSTDELARVVGPDDDLIMTNGWDESQLNDKTRAVFGASYYWVMDLAGSVWERTISIGLEGGRKFLGTHGDGRLGSRGRATNDDWPHDYRGDEGHGYRGGGFYDQGQISHEFNPYSPIAYRRFGGWAGSYPYRSYGFRCARTQP